VHDAQGSGQRGPARVFQGLSNQVPTLRRAHSEKEALYCLDTQRSVRDPSYEKRVIAFVDELVSPSEGISNQKAKGK
jgi:hypothetical protein